MVMTTSAATRTRLASIAIPRDYIRKNNARHPVRRPGARRSRFLVPYPWSLLHVAVAAVLTHPHAAFLVHVVAALRADTILAAFLVDQLAILGLLGVAEGIPRLLLFTLFIGLWLGLLRRLLLLRDSRDNGDAEGGGENRRPTKKAAAVDGSVSRELRHAVNLASGKKPVGQSVHKKTG